MNTPANAIPESSLNPVSHPLSTTQRLYWSLRRELWEYRSLYLAPVAGGAVALFGFLINAIHHRHEMPSILATFDHAKQHNAIAMPYDIAAGLVMAVAFLVQIFYCLEALQAERRDRSILFWKSLPVSDFATVLSKMVIPLAVPLYAFVVVVATHLVMLLISSAVLLGTDLSFAALWMRLTLPHSWMGLLYHLLTVHTLWYAPIYAWLLMASGWGRRAALLWATLPLLTIAVLEKLVFNTWYFAGMLRYRVTGPEAYPIPAATENAPMSMVTMASPGQFFSTPGLWIGLGLAVVFIAVAVRQRRYRGPL